MSAPISIHSSSVDGTRLRAITRAYLARERAHVFRRLFVTRFGLLALALVVAGAGFHWLSPLAVGFSIALCLIAPLGALIVEFRCDRQLARRLEELPNQHRVSPVRKS